MKLTNLACGEAELLLYQAEGGSTRVDVRFDGDTVRLWLGQMAERFQRDKSVISRHTKPDRHGLPRVCRASGEVSLTVRVVKFGFYHLLLTDRVSRELLAKAVQRTWARATSRPVWSPAP